MLTLRYRGTTTIPVEAECIRPDQPCKRREEGCFRPASPPPRWCGDLVSQGKGEVLHWRPD
jgi:hypothetical protein